MSSSISKPQTGNFSESLAFLMALKFSSPVAPYNPLANPLGNYNYKIPNSLGSHPFYFCERLCGIQNMKKLLLDPDLVFFFFCLGEGLSKTESSIPTLLHFRQPSAKNRLYTFFVPSPTPSIKCRGYLEHNRPRNVLCIWIWPVCWRDCWRDIVGKTFT